MKFSKFFLKAASLSSAGDMAKARRAFLKNLKNIDAAASASKGVLDTLKRASSAWTPQPVAPEPAKGNAQAHRHTQAHAHAQAPTHSTKDAPKDFSPRSFKFGSLEYPFRVFTPTRTDSSAIPMVVMLHGCKQDALDFSKGIDMHRLAEKEKFVVLYPEQLKRSNQSNCWNWFDPAHQSRGEGEPAMIAALTLQIANEYGVDPNRIYVAGLSAGGAMAALVGKLYPEVFAAVGVHSGLSPRSARDVMSAFQVMANGPKSSQTESIGRPLIIFQGTADHTVAPANAKAMIDAELALFASRRIAVREESLSTEKRIGGRAASTVKWKLPDGSTAMESCTIDGAGHAWAGGSKTGSYTDPDGPNASNALIRFFLAHRNKS